jgi:hypothetical protein
MVGFIIAYPINWWLVANHIKHGMMTVRPSAQAAGAAARGGHAGMAGMADDADGTGHMAQAASTMSMGAGQPTRPPLPLMTLASFLVLAGGVALAFLVTSKLIPGDSVVCASGRQHHLTRSQNSLSGRRIPPDPSWRLCRIGITACQGTRAVMARTCWTGGIPFKAVGGRTCPSRITRKLR